MRLHPWTRLRLAVSSTLVLGLTFLFPGRGVGQSSSCATPHVTYTCTTQCPATNACAPMYAGCTLTSTRTYCNDGICSDDWDYADNLLTCVYSGGTGSGGGGETDE
jgi:hypothetical protein